MRREGYKIHLFFLWLQSPELALGRIKERVIMGGHDVPAQIVLRRFDQGLCNLFHLYRALLDSWMLFDNSGKEPVVIAKETNGDKFIFDEKIYSQIRENVGA
jgi:predicted ABC-type ATPase